jgi:electron-transferring-flavoprotein dehydrogenase
VYSPLNHIRIKIDHYQQINGRKNMVIEELNCDVLVCGGGPGGVSAAFSLGKNGIDTILVDKKAYDQIGHKVCGDALSPILSDQAFDMIGLPRPNEENGELMEVLDDVYLYGKSPNARIKIGDGSATVDRLLYGQALIKVTDEFDCVNILANHKVREVIVEDNTVKGVVCDNPDGKIKINAKIVIDATGSRGIIRSRLPDSMHTKFPKKLPKEQTLVAYREILRLDKPHRFQNGLYLLYEPEIADVMPGYFWVFSKGPNIVNIGLGYLLTKDNHGKNIREINSKIRERHFPECEILESQGDQIPARMPFHSLVHNGFIMIGDAAALVNPVNGEGHGPAIFSGIKAAEHSIMALNKNDYSEEALWGFNKWIWNEFGILNSMGHVLIKFIQKYGYDAFDWLLANNVITEADIMIQLREPEEGYDIGYKRVFKLLTRPRLLFGLLKLNRINNKIQELSIKYPDIEYFDDWNTEMTKLLNKNV